MRFDILTLFPQLCETVLSESVIGRAQKSGAIEVRTHNIRDFAGNKHNRVDDTTYGGGKGMLMAAPPVVECHEAVLSDKKEGESVYTVYLSPRGNTFDQSVAKRLSQYNRLVLISGHYEGIDERAIELVGDEELSIGDYVLTGGEIPACIVVDAVARLVPGVLSSDECFEIESFSDGLLEYPQYTRPFEYRGLTVPEVLISGNHANIEKWRTEQAKRITEERRPDILKWSAPEKKKK
ncbi:MAG: tRNA (guanosine(37)-N1)-methyltransferase TrmD [Clostridia bacterium]|nr:tRNA (guanosine(37)-N1)-methyltransferase TrmD [Clostridia bacterium]